MSVFSAEMTRQICVAPAAIMRSTRYSATALGRSMPLMSREPTGSSSLEQPKGWILCPAPAAGMIPSIVGSWSRDGARPRLGRARLVEEGKQLFGPEIAGVFIQGALARAFGHALQLFVRRRQGFEHVMAIVGDKDLLVAEERVQATPPVGDQWRTAGRSLEEASRRAIAEPRHRIAGDVEGHARG